MGKSNIEWTEATWNPIVGCSILTPGCTNCYAMQMAARIEAMNAEARESERAKGKRHPVAAHYDGTTKKVNGKAVWTGKLALAPDSILLAPLKRRKPTTYFVNSMGDLFHENCPDEWIDKVFAVMALCPQHTFQVLTKRAGRMREYLTTLSKGAERARSNELVADWQIRLCEANAPGVLPITKNDVERRLGRAGKLDRDPPTPHWPLPNVWLGVSTERQKEADERIPLLLQTPAAVRLISAEPLLGPIDLDRLCGSTLDALSGHDFEAIGDIRDGGDLSRTQHPPAINWVITGGESGPNARPSHPQWFRDIRDQCGAAGVAYFHKQNGAYARWEPGLPAHCVIYLDRDGGQHLNPGINREPLAPVSKSRAGRLLDGITHDAMPSPKGHVITPPERRAGGK